MVSGVHSKLMSFTVLTDVGFVTTQNLSIFILYLL
jgi:hypothetical protein